MNHRWTVPCSRSIIDNKNNQISLMDIIEKIDAGVEVESIQEFKKNNGVLIMPLNFELVSFISDIVPGKDKGIEMKLAVLDPAGKQLQEAISKSEVTGSFTNMRVIMRVEGMPVNQTGVYTLRLSLKQNKAFVKVAEIPIEVILEIREKN